MLTNVKVKVVEVKKNGECIFLVYIDLKLGGNLFIVNCGVGLHGGSSNKIALNFFECFTFYLILLFMIKVLYSFLLWQMLFGSDISIAVQDPSYPVCCFGVTLPFSYICMDTFLFMLLIRMRILLCARDYFSYSYVGKSHPPFPNNRPTFLFQNEILPSILFCDFFLESVKQLHISWWVSVFINNSFG